MAGSGASAAPAGEVAVTREAALAERSRLLALPDWRAAFESGSAEHVATMKELLTVAGRGLWNFGVGVNSAALGGDLAAQAEGDRAARAALDSERVVDVLSRDAEIPDAVLDMVRNNTPVTAFERQKAEQERGRLMRDQIFVDKLQKGDREARSRWAILSIIMARPVQQGAA